MRKTLIGAMRQYRHNDSDEFVGGYDKLIIDKLFKTMQARIDELEARNAETVEYWEKYCEKRQAVIERMQDDILRYKQTISELRQI